MSARLIDALVIGAGPAGASTAIRLAQAGWDVVLIEKRRYPRQKVCGECITAGNLALLDELGIGPEFQRLAGPDLRQVGWMSAAGTVVADMPACADGLYRYGRALGRDRLDTLLLERARSVGVQILQPARVCKVSGAPGGFHCECELLEVPSGSVSGAGSQQTLHARVVVDAHGSWERGPSLSFDRPHTDKHPPRLGSDLLAFKASFRGASLPSGFLPVLALDGGYGGMVVAEDGRLTVACCIQRRRLQACRRLATDESAGAAIETYLRRSCPGVDAALATAQRDGPWLSVGPVCTGVNVASTPGLFRVGNAAGETHPLVGEGIGMGLQSAALLVQHITRRSAATFHPGRSAAVLGGYVVAWKREFATRFRVAQSFANLAMSPALAAPTGFVLRRLPRALTLAACLAGKARRGKYPGNLLQELT